MGLNLHISDIGTDLGVFLPPVAEFRKGKLNRSNSKVKTLKDKQKEEKESENDGKVKVKEEEKRKTKEELNKVKDEKKRAKEEENRIKEEKKKAKEEEEKRIKEEKKRIKEEEKQNAKNEKHYAKEENQQENGEKIRTKLWKKSSAHSPSPQSSQSLQSPLSSQPPQLQQYYPQPQPLIQPISPLSLQSRDSSEFSSSLSPLSIESSTFTRTGESRYDKYCQSPQSQQSFPSQQSPQSLQFPLSPFYIQRPPPTQPDTMQTIQIPQQYFRTPQDLQSASTQSKNSEQIDHSYASQYSQRIIGQFQSQESKRNLQSTPPAQTQFHSGVNAPLNQLEQQQRQLHDLEPIESSTPLKNPQNSRYQQKAQLLRRGRPISYPSNFRQIQFSSPEHSGEYPHIHSQQLEGNMQNTQYPYFSRSSFNAAYPYSSSSRSVQPRPASFGYQSTLNTESSLDASSIPSTASPQSADVKFPILHSYCTTQASINVTILAIKIGAIIYFTTAVYSKVVILPNNLGKKPLCISFTFYHPLLAHSFFKYFKK